MRRLLFLILVLGIVACQPILIENPATSPPIIITATPNDVTPTQESAWPTNTPEPTPTIWVDADPCPLVLGCGFKSVSSNSYLRNYTISQVRRTSTERFTVQTVPTAWYPYNLLETIDGLTGDEHGTRYAPIIYDGTGHRVTITGWAGEAGWSQDVQVEPGCYVFKAEVAWIIADEVFPAQHTYNYGLRGKVQRVGGNPLIFDRVTFGNLEEQDDVLLGVVYVGVPGVLSITGAASVAYATGDGWIRLDALEFGRDLDGDHCNGNTPGI